MGDNMKYKIRHKAYRFFSFAAVIFSLMFIVSCNKSSMITVETEVLVIESFDKNIFVTIDDRVFELRELQRNKKVSSEFGEVSEDNVRKKEKYIPPMTHPWKASYFKKQLKRAHTNHVYA